MADGKEGRRRRSAALAVLLNRLGRSPELTRLLLLVLVWGHVRARSGYTIVDAQPALKAPQQDTVPKGKGYSVKRPRQRFL